MYLCPPRSLTIDVKTFQTGAALYGRRPSCQESEDGPVWRVRPSCHSSRGVSGLAIPTQRSFRFLNQTSQLFMPSMLLSRSYLTDRGSRSSATEFE